MGGGGRGDFGTTLIDIIHHLRAQQSIKLFLMQIFGRNIFHAKKENHDIKNSFTKSDHAVSEADEETTLLATLKNTALDLGNYVSWTRTFSLFSVNISADREYLSV